MPEFSSYHPQRFSTAGTMRCRTHRSSGAFMATTLSCFPPGARSNPWVQVPRGLAADLFPVGVRTRRPLICVRNTSTVSRKRPDCHGRHVEPGAVGDQQVALLKAFDSHPTCRRTCAAPVEPREQVRAPHRLISPRRDRRHLGPAASRWSRSRPPAAASAYVDARRAPRERVLSGRSGTSACWRAVRRPSRYSRPLARRRRPATRTNLGDPVGLRHPPQGEPGAVGRE